MSWHDEMRNYHKRQERKEALTAMAAMAIYVLFVSAIAGTGLGIAIAVARFVAGI